MPLVRVKSAITSQNGPIQPGTYKREELGGADLAWLSKQGVVEVMGDRLWDTMLPDEPSSEQYCEEIQRLQAGYEEQYNRAETLAKTAEELRVELKNKAGRPGALNRFDEPDPKEGDALRADRDYWHTTATRQQNELAQMRTRLDRYSELLKVQEAGGTIDQNAFNEPGPDAEHVKGGTVEHRPAGEGPNTATTVPNLDAETIGTKHQPSPIRPTTKRHDAGK